MKIVIAGGGTAGWLSALFLAKQNLHRDEPAYDITLIESDDIPIIGAGEGSTGVLQKVLLSTLTELDGFGEKEFFENCNATFKLGIDCIDWNGVGDKFFESLSGTHTSLWPLDKDFTICSKYGNAPDSTPNKYLWENNLSPFVVNPNTKTNYDTGYAYHFDAHKVGEWFKKIALENGIKLQKGTITDTNVNSKNGVLDKVILKDGTEIESDFWIDCTGFNRVLSKAVGAEWVSYSEYLPINSALVYTHQYEEGEGIPNVTTAWAMPNGWMWQIPIHFDAHKVGEWFKKIALENGIKLQKGTITDTNVNSKNGVLDKVILKDGTEIESDFWIDCTGFNRVLSKAVGAEWVSYSEYLPINSALVYTHQYEEGEGIPNVTTAWAMPNGWMWQIPIQERLGCGYCYSDKFVSEEQALKEMQEITGRKIEPLRNIKFDSGRLKEVWKKNVLSIGLSSSFLEPLEATSIHSSIIQLVQLTQHHLSPYKEDMIRESNIKANNEHFNMMLDEFRALIQMHYITKRNDTPFWKYVHNDLKRDPLIESILEVCKWRVPNANDFPHYNGSAGWGVFNWILAGNDLIGKEVLDKSLHTHNFEKSSEQHYKHMVKEYEFDKRLFAPHTEFINWVIDSKEKNKKDLDKSK